MPNTFDKIRAAGKEAPPFGEQVLRWWGGYLSTHDHAIMSSSLGATLIGAFYVLVLGSPFNLYGVALLITSVATYFVRSKHTVLVTVALEALAVAGLLVAEPRLTAEAIATAVMCLATLGSYRSI